VIVDLYEKVCLADKRHDPVPIEYAQPLVTPEGGFKVGLCDRGRARGDCLRHPSVGPAVTRSVRQAGIQAVLAGRDHRLPADRLPIGAQDKGGDMVDLLPGQN
jgi:hypothetical protein